MKVTVKIMLKNGVLDPQGKAIEHALDTLGFEGVESVRQGKIIELDVSDNTSQNDIEKMCEQLLANPVIEDYEIQTA
ncbi:MAG: phosphoribosylformylglycinamidine synthase [Micavibrio sp.]|nr:phosphoribosylformylglycinamidine synthase [Micavibrio sp.]